ncbi:MAG: hypothetical protein KF834_04750 [Burkholderiales bacterium]|nr:hypothetical protein [Burkholderiales bacterium]
MTTSSFDRVAEFDAEVRREAAETKKSLSAVAATKMIEAVKGYVARNLTRALDPVQRKQESTDQLLADLEQRIATLEAQARKPPGG